MNSSDETEKLLLIFISLKPFTAGLSLSVSKKVHSVSVINLIWAIPLWEIAKCVIYSREWFSTNIQNSRVINISIGLAWFWVLLSLKWSILAKGQDPRGMWLQRENYQYHFSQLCGSWFKTTLFFHFFCFHFFRVLLHIQSTHFETFLVSDPRYIGDARLWNM